MKSIRPIVVIFVITAFYSNTYCATKPPTDIKGNLITLKQSLASLKTKLDSLSKKLGSIKTKLLITNEKENLCTQEASGTSGKWYSFNVDPIKRIGIKIFRKEGIVQDLAIEFYTWEHIQKMYSFIHTKKNLPEEWVQMPYSEFLYSSHHMGVYESKDLNTSLILMEIEKQLGNLKPKVELTNKTYLIMDNLSSASDINFHLKVAADGWLESLKNFIQTKMTQYLPNLQSGKNPAEQELSSKQKKYLDQLVLKIGYTLLFFYYMGVTVEDCDMFITINPESTQINDLIKATRIKLVDFGESRIFYRNDGKKIIPVDDSWYKSAGKEDCIKIVIQNKNQTTIQMAKSFGGNSLPDNVTTYLGDMTDKFKNSFKLLNEFPAIKPQVKAKFEELKKEFGALKYDTEIDKIL